MVNSSKPKEIPICGLLIPYTPEFQLEAAKEIPELECCPHIETMVNDYAKTRNSIRNCLNTSRM